MSIADLDRFKANSKLFGLMDEPGIARMAAIAVPTSFKPGDDIITEGARGDTFYLITQGGVRVSIDAGQEVARLGSGAFERE